MPWVPGQSGNPDGGASRKPIRDAINLELTMMEQGGLDSLPKLSARAMVRAQIAKACAGDTNAFNAIADRSDGKPRQVITGDAAEPLALRVERGDDAREHIIAELGRIAARQTIIAEATEPLILKKE